MLSEPDKVAKHIIKLLGGPSKASAALDDGHRIISARWDQNIVTIGRILRSHLFVEHYMTEFLIDRNPELGSIAEARLTFVQKLALIGEGTTRMSYLIPGIRRLNAIRNRLTHTLSADVSTDDTNVFLGIKMFKTMRDALAKPGKPSIDPIDILEEFAKHVGIVLQTNPVLSNEIVSEAIRLAEKEVRQVNNEAET